MILLLSSYNPWGNPSPNSKGVSKQIQENIRRVLRKKSGGSPPPLNRIFLWIVPLFLLSIWAFSGFYQVLEGETGVVLRFGEVVGQTNPGLRYHLPYPIESVLVHNISEIKLTNSSVEKNTDNEQSLILTGDENMVQTNYTVRWKIDNIQKYLFHIRNSEKIIRIVAESVLREVVGQATAREALTEGRKQIRGKSQELLQQLIDRYQMGIRVISFELQRVAPPGQVLEAFNDMQASIIDSETIQNKAKAYRNELLPKTRGEAAGIVQSAEAYRAKAITEAEGEASRLSQLLATFKKNPTAYAQYYFKTLEEIFRNSNTTIVDSKVSQSVLPHLMLNKNPGGGRESKKSAAAKSLPSVTTELPVLSSQQNSHNGY